MRKHEYQATTLTCYWNLFTNAYEEAIQSLICPGRAQYELSELGPSTFNFDTENNNQEMSAIREDFQITNIRGERLECSFWHKTPLSQENHVPPCILYLHGMSSSRKEVIYIRDKILSTGFSLFALDLSGSGKSEGEHVTYGHNEKEDVRAVMDFLFASNKASAVGIWGRCIGGAAALLHLRDTQSFQYKTSITTKTQALQLVVQEDSETGYLLIAEPSRYLPFRLTTTSARNGDFVILSVGATMVRHMSVTAFYQLIRDQPEETIRIAGYQHSRSEKSSALPISFVFGLVLDSTFGDMERVIGDMLGSITKSAKKRDIVFTSPMVSAASKLMSRSIYKRAGFHLKDIDVVNDVRQFNLPTLFVCASQVDFIRPDHLKALYDAYGGFKKWLPFIGEHDQNRPEMIVNSICTHLLTQWKSHTT